MKSKYRPGQLIKFIGNDHYTLSAGLLNFQQWKFAKPTDSKVLRSSIYLIKKIVTEDTNLTEYLAWDMNKKQTGVFIEEECELIVTNYNQYWTKLNE